MSNTKIQQAFLYFLVMPVVIYCYFLKWKTVTIYGDDLYVYKDYFDAGKHIAKCNMSTIYEKYRPVHDIVVDLLIRIFNKRIEWYYVFNVAIQTINAVIFARIALVFIRSVYLSAILGLMVGISRFSYYNISQLFNGGALEGLAMTFFLLTLFTTVRALTGERPTEKIVWNNALLSLLFANLSLYTHERYIVILPFIFLVFSLTNRFRILPLRRRIDLSFLVFVSLTLNVVIKKLVFSMPFFVGTGGSKIEFSIERAVGYLHDGLLSILQINSGPDYLSGAHFNSLPAFNKFLVELVVVTVGVVFLIKIALLVKTLLQKNITDDEQKSRQFTTSPNTLILLLICLFFLFLLPAIVTIRLEQRWLQASYSIFLLIVVIAVSDIKINVAKWAVFTLTLISGIALFNDFQYLYRGIPYLYLTGAQNAATLFEKGLKNEAIRPNARKIYIVEKVRNENDENGLIWAIGNGYLIRFYKDTTKTIAFVDSVYQRTTSATDTTFKNYNPEKEEIILLKDQVIDLTKQYKLDTLRTIKFD